MPFCGLARELGEPIESILRDSGDCETLARSEWSLHVSPPLALARRPRLTNLCLTTINSALPSSWEVVTTLDFEWDAIRGRRPYRWTMWVRINCSVNLVAQARPRAL